jgi:hypothetical protein
MMTAGHRAVAGLNVQDGLAVSFEDMGADLHALYSGQGSTITIEALARDLQALYGSAPLPISQRDLLAELRELYGDAEVSWADFRTDFEALYTNHAV